MGPTRSSLATSLLIPRRVVRRIASPAGASQCVLAAEASGSIHCPADKTQVRGACCPFALSIGFSGRAFE